MFSMLSAQSSSADGSVWQTRTFIASLENPRVFYANNLFILIDATPGTFYTSADGINWTSRSVNSSFRYMYDITYGNGIYVATGENWQVQSKQFYSSDGINWQLTNEVPGWGNQWVVTFGAGKFVAAKGGNCGTNCIAYSSNGVDWSVATTPNLGTGPQINFTDIIFTGTTFYAVSGGGAVWTSGDGTSWTHHTYISGVSPWTTYVTELVFGNSTVVGVGPGGIVRTSTTNPAQWTSRTANPSGNITWADVEFGANNFVAISSEGDIMRSSDGVSWSNAGRRATALSSLAFGNGVFVAVGTGTTYYTSALAPAFTLSTSSQSVTQNSAITTVTSSSTGGTISSYAISPAAPAGLTFNTSTGQLSGTPTATQSATIYTITGTNAGGSASQTFTLTVNSSKITPTLSWSNVSKSYGDSPFTLTTPTASTEGTFTYSSATPGVIALNNVNTDSATVVAPGTSLITASFTPADTSTYNSATTTMTVTVSKATQAALSFALSTASKNQPYSQAITMTPSGGTGTGAITYAIAAGGSASSCALANSTETNTVTATSGGTCLIQATKATDTNYLVATSATQTFTFNPPLSLTYAAGELGTGTVPTLSGAYFTSDTTTVATGSTLSRAGFTFNGWRNSGNTSVAAGSTLTFSTSETLTAQWRQSSLFGLSDNEISELQSWNASVNNVSSTISNASSSFTVTIPGGSLPTGTTVKLWEIGNSNLALSKLGSGKDYILNLVVSWLKSDGTVPTATSPVTISISNNTIKNGATAYQIIGDTVTPIGTATADGVINLSVTEDPAITVANPPVVVSPGSGSSGSSGDPSPTASSSPAVVVSPGSGSSGDPSPTASSSGDGSLAGGGLGSKPRPAAVTPTTPILKTSDGKTIFTAKGDTKRIVDGVVQVELVQIMNETSIKTELSGVVLEIKSIDIKNLDKKVDASNTLVFEQTGKAALSGTGFKPDSTVKVWIFSEPTFLGEIPVKSDGTFEAKLLVPASMQIGDHTLQINGVSPSQELMSQTIGIVVVAPVVTEAKPALVEQDKNLVVMSHKVGFGRSAAWINANNIRAIRKFMSQVSESFVVKRVIIKGYEQPSMITLPKIDLARANAVRKFLRNEGYNYPIVSKGMGVAKSRSADLSRVAILTIEGKLKS